MARLGTDGASLDWKDGGLRSRSWLDLSVDAEHSSPFPRPSPGFMGSCGGFAHTLSATTL